MRRRYARAFVWVRHLIVATLTSAGWSTEWPTGGAWADFVYVAGIANPPRVTITGIAPGQPPDHADGPVLTYTVNDRPQSRPLSRVQRVEVDGQPAFNAADAAYAAGRPADAVEGYLRVVRAGPGVSDWLRRYAAERLIPSATAARRHDVATLGFVELSRHDPGAAASARPTFADANARTLDAAVTVLERAIADATSSDERRSLQTLLIDLHRARGDESAASGVLERLVASDTGRADDGTHDGAASGRPTDVRVLQQIRLAEARAAVTAGDWPRAAGVVNASRAAFVDPDAQAEALLILADAAAASAGHDPAALADAAIAYLRVVAHFSEDPAHATAVERAEQSAGTILSRLDWSGR